MGWGMARGTFVSVQAKEAYSEAEVYLYSFLTLALEWDEC